MKTFMRYSLMALVAMTITFISCRKESSDNPVPAGQSRLSVYLLDGPGDFQNVFIDIQAIEVRVDTCSVIDTVNNQCPIWQPLAVNPGIYDLLTLSNGADTLLASGFLFNGRISRIKLTLGTQNTVVVDSVSHPLTLPGNLRDVYVNLGREHLDSLSSNSFQVYLDFDVERSIVHTGNGRYILKPVLHAFSAQATGEIKGKVRPSGSYRMIKAYSATDTGYARPTPRHHNGEFMIRGLDPGTYSLFIEGANGYRDTTIDQLQVQRNRFTDAGNIQMNQ